MILKKKNIEIATLKTSVMKQRSGRGHTWDPTTAAAFDYESVFKSRISPVHTGTASKLFTTRDLFLVVGKFGLNGSTSHSSKKTLIPPEGLDETKSKFN